MSRTRRRLRQSANEPDVVDLLNSDEEEDAPPVAHIPKQEHTSPSPASPATRQRRRTSSSSSTPSSQPGLARRAQQPDQAGAGDEKVEEKGREGEEEEQREEEGEEKKDGEVSLAPAPYASHFNGVSYHQLSSSLTSLQHSSNALLKAVTTASTLIDGVLTTLPAALLPAAEASYEAHFLLEGRVRAEQGHALDRAKELVVQGDVGWTTDWQQVMADGWKEGGELRRQRQREEIADLERRKAARLRRREQFVREEEGEEEKEAPAPANAGEDDGEEEEEEDEKKAAPSGGARVKRETRQR